MILEEINPLINIKIENFKKKIKVAF